MLYWPPGHRVQAGDPDTLLNCAMGHEVHAVEPAREYCPAAHRPPQVGEVSPVPPPPPPAYEPARHGKHDAEPVTLMY